MDTSPFVLLSPSGRPSDQPLDHRPQSTSPAFTHRTIPSISSDRDRASLTLDKSLPTALANLTHHLVKPLAPHYSNATLVALREALSRVLTERFKPTWDEANPDLGSGARSLICDKYHGLPPQLQAAGKIAGVNEIVWRSALASKRTREGDDAIVKEEWEAWCDPGYVVWRYGGWEWEDAGYDPHRLPKQTFKVIWQAQHGEITSPTTAMAPALTPARVNKAIPIRAPEVVHIPPTPMHHESASVPIASVPATPSPTSADAPSPKLMPAASVAEDSPAQMTRAARSGSTSSSGSDMILTDQSMAMSEADEIHPHPIQIGLSSRHRSARSNGGSTSSLDSAYTSEANSSAQTQLLTPASRPAIDEAYLPTVSLLEELSLKGLGKTPTPTAPVAAHRGRASPHFPGDGDDAITPTPGSTQATPGGEKKDTPSVTPYDGGNVTVLGGGVKLGGSSRASSAANRSSANGTPFDRSRSPSISLASRALNTALGPNMGSPGASPRKARRRRIIPTYLGGISQAGPVMGAFSQFAGKIQPGGYQFAHQPFPHGPAPPPGLSPPPMGVGVGMSPPPMPMSTMPQGLGLRPGPMARQLS